MSKKKLIKHRSSKQNNKQDKLVSLVDHPQHYNQATAKCKKCGHDIECIDVVREMNFNLGNAIKYIWRSSHKGIPLMDLAKASWYIGDEIARLSGKIS
jgi:ribosomal protein L34E